MESWRLVWRDGFVPVLSTAGLEALRDALRGDDPRLTQGSTTTPPPLMCVQDWPVEAACALGFCGWQGDELESVGVSARAGDKQVAPLDLPRVLAHAAHLDVGHAGERKSGVELTQERMQEHQGASLPNPYSASGAAASLPTGTDGIEAITREGANQRGASP